MEKARAHLEQFKDIESNVEVRETRVELLEVGVVDVLEDDGRGFGLRGRREKAKEAVVSLSSTAI